MQVLRPKDRGYAAALKKLNRRATPDPKVRDVVAGVLDAVVKKGDAAVLEFTEKFGGPRLTAIYR